MTRANSPKSPDRATDARVADVRVADALARRLYEAGCRYAFGMPGGEVLTVIDALEKAGIRFILAKHENAAGFMAEGVHHRDGAPAVLVATLGPGAMNAVNVIANAEQDRVPMIAITGCVDEYESHRYTHQVLDHRAVFKPITRDSFTLSPENAALVADKAVNLAMGKKPGPVHLDVPISVAETLMPETPASETRAQAALAAQAAPIASVAPVAPVAPAGESLERACRWVREAEKPLMIIGLETLNDPRAASEIADFLEHFSVPFITTYKAKGIVPENHPLCLGAAGLSPLADEILKPLIDASDLIMCIGYDPIEMRSGWRDIWSLDARLVLDVRAVHDLHYMHQSHLRIIADIGESLKAIGHGARQGAQKGARKGGSGKNLWADGMPEKVKRNLSAAFRADEEWGPAAIIDETRKIAPEEAIATADSGAHRILLSQIWRCFDEKTLLQSSGLCTMGCAVPLAIGSKIGSEIAAPAKPVIAFCGDGGMLMVAGELASAADIGGPLVFIVFVDASLALIELKRNRRKLENCGVNFARCDFAAIARAFGGNGFDVKSRAELRQALEKGLKDRNFTLIAAHIDAKDYEGRF